MWRRPGLALLHHYEACWVVLRSECRQSFKNTCQAKFTAYSIVLSVVCTILMVSQMDAAMEWLRSSVAMMNGNYSLDDLRNILESISQRSSSLSQATNFSQEVEEVDEYAIDPTTQ